MPLGEAMGKSCNPVFARVAMNHLSKPIMWQYARSFGFNVNIPFEVPLQMSTFQMDNSDYEFARTAAGFGDVKISPVHAALIAASIGNGGVMMKPHVVDRIVDEKGKLVLKNAPTPFRRTVLANTAEELIEMMRETVIGGTAKKYYAKKPNTALQYVDVAGKTGTLRGDDPKGLYHWFIGVAPSDAPEVAIATLVIEENGALIKASALSRIMLESYFRDKAGLEPMIIKPEVPVKPVKHLKKGKTKRLKTATPAKKKVVKKRKK